MINVLHIKNIGIIDDLTIDFNNGLNVLTGETGAGKTLIIDSLNIICGERFSKEMIRNGEEISFVELQLLDEKTNEDIIVSREVNSNGKNVCKINGRLVTVADLKEFMMDKIDIHAQNDNLNLLNKAEQLKYLDSFSGSKMIKLKEEYKIKFDEYIDIKNKLYENYGDEREKQRRIDLLKYQYSEIDEADLKDGEEQELEQEIKLINNSEKIYQNLNDASNKIENNAIDSINEAIRNMEKIEEYSDKYLNILNIIKSSFYDLQEVSRDLYDEASKVSFDQQRKYDISTRLDTIYSLKKKYGNNIHEILKYKDEVEDEINKIEGLDKYISELNSRKDILEKELYDLAAQMNIIRTKSSTELQDRINAELNDLEMKNAEFFVDISFNKEKEFNKNGLDDVQFMIKTNVGEDKKSLSKIASGGETSRIMLAIKTVLSDVDNIDTFIFDEIDTGISGVAADKVGNKLKTISKKHQILIVTHLANIAARGDYNYYIHKEVNDDKTSTSIDLLNEDETIREIARIASGKITEISIEHAKELRNIA